jgi:dolichyl-phosphate-mannose-protein mannosyltransferase
MALMARLRALIARNPFFAVALAAGAALRLVAMVGYPGALWFAGDSYVYLGAALRLQPNLSKTTGYSLFLKALEPFHSLTLVAGLQHLMGLGIAVMIYVLARRSGVSQRWATAATLPVLLDGFFIEDEHMIMAEALFTFLIMLSMLLILWRGTYSRQIGWPVALVAGLLAGYAVDVRSEGLPVLVLFPVVLLIRGLRQDGAWRWRRWRAWLAAAVMALGCVAPVAAYAAWFHSWYGSYTLSRAGGFYLWGRVSSFAECSVIKPPARELSICPTGPPSSRRPPGDYIWHAPQVRHLPNGGPVSAANDALLRDFAIRAIEAQPLGYLHAVLGGLAMSVEWPRRDDYPSAGTVYLYYFHLTPWTIPVHTWVAGGDAYSDAVQYGHATPSRVVRPVAFLIDGYERVFYTYGPLFGLILLTGLGGVLRIRRRPGGIPALAWSPRAGSMLPWLTGVVLLVFPIAVADFDYRYLLPVLPFISLAAGLAFAPARKVTVPPQGDAAGETPPVPAQAPDPGAVGHADQSASGVS